MIADVRMIAELPRDVQLEILKRVDMDARVALGLYPRIVVSTNDRLRRSQKSRLEEGSIFGRFRSLG